ncbi:MAG TPA: NAD(P)-dependent oxidoreductase [Ktedonobacteraceae bacterium]|jgi:nucleoside-diphosphate-sugar epimerase|nr:NAD(P)-dependent oxidoreductase [Ktedonobacteraceae bacterium]
MKVLLTGAFGNIGRSTLDELLRQGHTVRCFVSRRKSHERTARRYEGKIELIQGDIRQSADLTKAVQDQEVIVHLAYMIPPPSEDNPLLAHSINIDGTRNLLRAARKLPNPPKFFFASSFDVFGYTQDEPPPRKVCDPVQATDHYSTHKIACEEMVKTSGLEWAIFRFADVPPLALRSPHPIMFRIPLDNRFEVIHTYDAGLAITNGISSNDIWGRVLLIGGGSGCQIRYRDYLGRMLELMGIGMLPEEAFGHEPYCTDWLDTEESQRLLHYQRYSFDDIMKHLKQSVGYQRILTSLVGPLARKWLLRMSPYYKKRR